MCEDANEINGLLKNLKKFEETSIIPKIHDFQWKVLEAWSLDCESKGRYIPFPRIPDKPRALRLA